MSEKDRSRFGFLPPGEGLDDGEDSGVALFFGVRSSRESPLGKPSGEASEDGLDDGKVVVGGSVGDEFEEDGEFEGVGFGVGVEGERVEDGDDGAVAGGSGGIGEADGILGESVDEDEKESGVVVHVEKGEEEGKDEIGESFEFAVGSLESRALERVYEDGNDLTLFLTSLLRFDRF